MTSKGNDIMNATLHDYQQQAADFAVATPKCGLFLDLGLGKTLITLSVLERVYADEPGHILIIAPKSIAKATWAEEIRKWDIKLPYKSLIVNERGRNLSRQKRFEAYIAAFNNPVKTVYFINREMLVDLISNCPVCNKSIIWPFQTIVIDELQSFKSPSSKRFTELKKVMPAVNRFIGLTGTPTPNGIDDIWSQIFLMDGGKRLGKNITAFRTAYMRPGYINSTGVVCSWNPVAGAEEEICDKISDIVISMKNHSFKLPPIVFIDDMVEMSESEQKKYKTFLTDAVLTFDDNTTASAANAAVMSAKLQQLASGAVYTIDSNGNPTGSYNVIHQSKLERLMYIRENSDDNILIAYWFKSDADMIMNYFKQNNLPCEIFDSNKSEEYVRRWNNGEIKTLLIQPASSGFGLNLQYASHTLVWYTLPFSLEKYLQTIGRIYRQGQTHTVYVHRIMTDKTIDAHVLSTLVNRDDEMKRVLGAVEYAPGQSESVTALSTAIALSAKMPITSDDMLKAVKNAIAEIQ